MGPPRCNHDRDYDCDHSGNESVSLGSSKVPGRPVMGRTERRRVVSHPVGVVSVSGGDPAADSPRLPCYDLSPLAKPRFDPLMGASSGPHSGALTGGVCKEQGRIHRALLKRDYYRIQLHADEFQSAIRTTIEFRRLASPFGVASHCLDHCSPRVAQHIRGILTYRCPFLPPVWHWQSS